MFGWLISSSLKFRILALAGALILFTFGAIQYRDVPVVAFPEFKAPTVEVQTEALGLSAREVESLVTLNLEELLSGVPWLESITSRSVTGLSSIILTFKYGTDIMKARQMVQERLTLAYLLPNVAKPPVILQPLSVASRIMMISVSSDKIDPADLSIIARWTMKPALLGVPGVANVAVWGQRLRQLHVHIDPDRLRDARLLQEDVIAATGDALWQTPLTFLRGSAPGTGGWIDNANQRLGVLHHQPIRTPEDLAQLPLTPVHLTMTGKKLKLGEVAEVTDSHPPLIGDAIVNGRTGLLLVIEQFPGANTLEVTRAVDKALSELSLGLPDVKIDANIYRQAWYLDAAKDNVGLALIIGMGLLAVLLALYFLNWRSFAVVAVSVPLSLVAAVVVLQLSGVALNMMILTGLFLGLAVVVYDSIIDVDSVQEALRRRGDGDASLGAVIYQTAQETRSALSYALWVIGVCVTPFFFLGGAAGEFFWPAVVSYLLAMVLAMVVALTVTPALSILLLRNDSGSATASSPASAITSLLAPLGRVLIRAPQAVVVGSCVVILGGAYLATLPESSLLPPVKEQSVVVDLAAAPGTSHPETFRITARLSKELEGVKGVRSVSAHVGRAITSDQIVGINSAQIWVNLGPDADHDETLSRVRETVDGYPGLAKSVRFYLRNQAAEILTGAERQVVVRVYGKDHDVLRKFAGDVKNSLSGIEGLVGLQTKGEALEPQIKVMTKLDSAGSANVKPGDVRRASATVFSGLEVGYLFEEQKIYDVVVWGAPEKRQSISDLDNIWVERPNRTHVRLKDVAEVSVVPAQAVIRHENISSFVDIVADVKGRDLASVNRDIRSRLEKIKFPVEYFPEIRGEFAKRLQVENRLLGAFVAVAIAIFLLLQACFRSWRLAVAGFLGIPLALLGGILAAVIADGVLTVGAITGLLGVLAISARNSILTIRGMQRCEGQEGLATGDEVAMAGLRMHLPSIVAATAAVIAVLVPGVVFGQVSGLEILAPLAVVTIGGAIASLVYSLLALPALYAAWRSPDVDEIGEAMAQA